MKKNGIAVVLFLTVCVFSANALATDYYISTSGNDNNTGTSPAQPWATLQKIQTYDTHYGFDPGDNILLCKGDTWDNESMIIASSGTESQRITIGSYGTGAKPVINVGGLHYGIYLQGSYLTIDGLDIRGGSYRSDLGNYYLYEQGNVLLFSNDGRTYRQGTCFVPGMGFAPCKLINDDNLTFLEGIKIINTTFKDSKNNIITANGTNNLVIENNDITSTTEFYDTMLDAVTDNGSSEYGQCAIQLNNTNDTRIEKNNFHKIKSAIWNFPQAYMEDILLAILEADNGTIYRGGYDNPGALIGLNRFEDILGIPIQLAGDNQTLEHNFFKNNGYGVYCPHGGNPPCINISGTNNAVIRYNVITEVRRACSENPGDNEAVAIYFDCDHTNGKVYGNVVYNVEGPALVMAKSTDMEVYNNTFFDCNNEFGPNEMADGGTIGIWGPVMDGNNQAISTGIIANNIIMNDNRWEITMQMGAKADFYNNIIYHDNSTAWSERFATKDNGTISRLNFYEFQSIVEARGCDFDDNQFEDPLMSDPDNASNPKFTLLSNSPCIDTGLTLDIKNAITGTDENLNSINGCSDTSVLTVGDNGTIYLYKDNEWQKIVSPTPQNLNGVWYNPLIAYIAGDNGTLLGNGFWMPHWMAIETGTTATLYDVWASSCDSVYIVGEGGTILHLDESGVTAMDSGTTKDLYAVWGTSDSNVYAVGAFNAVLHYDGNDNGTWEQDPAVPSGWYWHTGIWGSSESDIYLVGVGTDAVNYPGTILHFDGTDWDPVPSGVEYKLYDVWGNAYDTVYIVGEEGTVLHYDGNDNGTFTQENFQFTDSLWGVWLNSQGELFIAGDNGTIMPDSVGPEWGLDPGTPLQQGEPSLPLPTLNQMLYNMWDVGAYIYKE